MAGIEKTAIPGPNGIKLYWWPKLPSVPSWQEDKDFSFHYNFNALAPVGKSFGNSEAVMYAKAIYKPRVPNVKSLAMLIENDKNDFVASTPGIVIQEAPPLVSADGRTLQSLYYLPKGKGNWERVSYLEEGEFYLIFTLSSRSESGFKAAAQAYESLVMQYRE